MSLADFHPAIQTWFRETLGAPTDAQAAAWPEIRSGGNVLISAPTGSGKTLAAWLPLIDRVVREPASAPGVRVVYVSPLRALSRDMAANLAAPLAPFEDTAGGWMPRIGLRTGDTAPAERTRQRRCPPELLITTPESLFVMLGSSGGRGMLRGCGSVVVDEIHALAGNKRGAHLSLSVERLEELTGGPLQRIGISATVRPLAAMGEFLCGTDRRCIAVEPAIAPAPEIAIELPDCPLGPFPHQQHWHQIHDRISELARQHTAILVFCRTRGQVERTAAALSERLGENRVAAHHGSLDRNRRHQVESDFKHGRLRIVVSSASLELGLDLGGVDLVCQLGAPGAANLLRQRAGRACHRPGERPRARLFPLTLGDLLEARALLDALNCGFIEATGIVPAARDVLCQQLVAMGAQGIEDPDALYATCRRAQPWNGMSRTDFDQVVQMLSDGFVPGREGHRALLSKRADGRGLAASEAAGRLARMNAGTIPDWFEYRVCLHPGGRELGRLDEEFAFESAPGQILQLGNATWQVLKIQPGIVWVKAAPDEVANVPFWFGDGSGRSAELAARILLALDDFQALSATCEPQLHDHLQESRRTLGRLPGTGRIVVERFFDPVGDQHVVLHTFQGARINRAWGLALRKRFCRRFNFELQAAATDDGILLSLGPTHSFDLAEIVSYVTSASVEETLIQALLDTPLFQTRLRWCATTALAILRRTGRGPVSPQIQRTQTENLIARIFPDQLACLENLDGPRQIPDHPLVLQALDDCLHEHMDLQRLRRLLEGIEHGQVEVHAVETSAPSPMALALIYAPRYSFLDPAAAEERRTRSFESPRFAPRTAATARLDTPTANSLARCAWIHDPSVRGFEQGLRRAGYLLQIEGESGTSATGARFCGGWARAFSALVRNRAAASFRPGPDRCLWAALDRLPELRAVWPEGEIRPWFPAGMIPEPLADADEALVRLLLGRVRVLGRVKSSLLISETGVGSGRVEQALSRLMAEGVLMRRDGAWIERGVAAEYGRSAAAELARNFKPSWSNHRRGGDCPNLAPGAIYFQKGGGR